MIKKLLIKYPSYIAIFAICASTIMMTQPWRWVTENFSFEQLLDPSYLLLVGWVISPYLALIILFRKSGKSRSERVINVIASSLICLPPLYWKFDTIFIHRDAQGIFLFLYLPIFQWFVAGIIIIVVMIIRNKENLKNGY